MASPVPTAAPSRPRFSVVLPVFNEERGLPATLERLRDVLRDHDGTHELVVVDDGSTDGTAAVLAACTDLTVIRHECNRGYGASLKSGLCAARHSLIVVLDADGTYDAAAIPSLVAGCASADMVVGARVGRNVQRTPARSALKWWFRQFAQWITGAAIPDLNSGLRAFHRPVAERFFSLLPDGYSFTTTITVASILEGLVVRFEAVDYLPRIGRSKLDPLRDPLRIARQLLRLGLRLSPFRTSVALALPLLLALLGAAVRHVLVPAAAAPWELWGLAAAGLLLGLGLGLGLAGEQRVRRRRSLDAGAGSIQLS